MNRLNKLLLSFVLLIFCLLINVSHAFPDLYFYNNYLTGISPYYYTGSVDDSNIYYYPNSIMEENSRTGVVISFDNTYMSGATPRSAVPLVDLNTTIGHTFSLPAGHTFVLHASDSSVVRNIWVSSSVYAIQLGFSKPSVNIIDDNLASDNSESTSLKTYNQWYSYFNNADAFYFNNVYHGTSLSTSIVGTSEDGSCSGVVQIFNTSNSPIYFTISKELSDFSNLDENIEVDSISYDNYSSIYVDYSFDNQTNNLINFPHIDGVIDIYYPHSKSFSSPVSKFNIGVFYNVNTSFFLTNNDTNVGLGVDSKGLFSSSSSNLAFSQPQNEYIPYFLNTSIWQLSKQAIWIKNGYIAINNYDELISKLEQSGMGQTDLTRVVELLDDINTGGETGEEVKELIGILEAYHQQLQNQANFGSATGIFDTYKNILEFSSDMHWLITANNALFEYFAGFIMMCALFLFLSRVMR